MVRHVRPGLPLRFEEKQTDPLPPPFRFDYLYVSPTVLPTYLSIYLSIYIP